MARMHAHYSGIERIHGFSYSRKAVSFCLLSFSSILVINCNVNLGFRLTC
jgi:hypothetical protein